MDERLKKVEEEIQKIKDKKNKIMFLVIDTKGNPSGSIDYIYNTAMSLKKAGYNVEMIHQETDFMGPYDWMGEEYKDLTHRSIEPENITVSPSDVLVIPEIFSGSLNTLSELPCKKVMLIQNFEYVNEFMPKGVSFGYYGIIDAITTSERQKEYIEEMFPYMHVYVIKPGISAMFRASDKPKKLIVNIYTKDYKQLNQIVHPLIFKYPIFKWISFRDLRGMSQENMAEALRESQITVWLDRDTNFGYVPLQALKCDNIVIGMLPDHPSDWMLDGEELTSDILWFDDIRKLPDILGSVIRSWTLDKVPEELISHNGKYKDMYTFNENRNDAVECFENNIFKKRIADFEDAVAILDKGKKEE